MYNNYSVWCKKHKVSNYHTYQHSKYIYECDHGTLLFIFIDKLILYIQITGYGELMLCSLVDRYCV